MKKIILAVIVLGLIGGGWWYWKGRKPAKDPAETVTTAKVERGNIRMAVASNGRVVSNLDVEIKCKASGEIVKLPYDVSDEVKKGDLLLELDPVDQERVLKQSEVTLKASQSRLATAKENLTIAERTLDTDKRRAQASLISAEASAKDAEGKAKRVQELFAAKLASQEECDTAVSAAASAQASLEGAKIKLDELKTQEEGLELSRQQVALAEAQVEGDQISYSVAQDRLSDTKVMAPMDGVISARSVQTGQIIASAVSNVGGGTTIMTLSDLSQIFVLASVDESDIGKIQAGQPAEISADAWPGRTFEGQVVRIATKGVNTSNVVTFEVKIEVTSRSKARLKPEMTTSVTIISAQKDDVLAVPAEALARKQGKTYVTLVKADGTNEEKPVQLGIADDTKTEIVDGLAEGDTVVLHKNAADSRFNAQRGQGAPRGMMMPGMGGGGRGMGGGGGRGGR